MISALLIMILILPGQRICFFQTALACAAPANNYIATRAIVIALPTDRIPSLTKAVPIWMVAIVKPTLGNTKAHYTR
jgi:hypothetical protein